MQARACPDDLTSWHRRAGASELEQRALAAHLEHCELCRAATKLAAIFDAVPDAMPGDDELLGRLARRAAGARRPWARRWFTRMVAVAATLVLVGGGTAAAAWMWFHREGATVFPDQRSKATAPNRDSGAGSHRALTPAPSPAAAREPSPNFVAPTPTPTMPAPSPPKSLPKRRTTAAVETARQPVQPAQPVVGPEALFAEANAVRRRGEIRRAISLYRTLQQRFPRSPEARSSSVFLGGLLLCLGDLSQAVAAFDSYLSDPEGEMTEEALFGRGRALERLGRTDGEIANWTDLLRRYPRSAYRDFATRRMKELDGRAPGEPAGHPKPR